MNAKPKTHWLRFSLRTMLIVVTVLCVLLGWKVRQVERQKAAVEWVDEMGGLVFYDYEWLSHQPSKPTPELPGPRWLRELIGVDYFATVVAVTSFTAQFTDLSPLSSLANLETLDIDDATTGDLTPLAHLSNLKELNMERTPVTDLSPLANLTNLKELSLEETRVTDLSPLVNLTNLAFLDLRGTPITVEKIAKLKMTLPNCDIRFYGPEDGRGTQLE